MLDLPNIREKLRVRLTAKVRERIFVDVGSDNCRELSEILSANNEK